MTRSLNFFAATAVRLLAAIVIALAAVSAGLAQERIEIPGTRVSLIPPPGFVLNPVATGMVNPDTNSTMIVFELPPDKSSDMRIAFGDLETASAAFGAQGLVVETLEILPRNCCSPLRVIHGTQMDQGVEVDKWIAFDGNEIGNIFAFNINPINPPDDDIIRASLTSIEMGAMVTIEEAMAALPYGVTVIEPFGNPRILAGVVLLAQVQPAEGEATVSNFVLTWQVKGPRHGSAAEIAEEQLRSIKTLQNVVIETNEAVTFAGVEGVRMTGPAEGQGNQLRFAFYISVIDGAYVAAVATVPANRAETLLPIVESMAQSVRKQ